MPVQARVQKENNAKKKMPNFSSSNEKSSSKILSAAMVDILNRDAQC